MIPPKHPRPASLRANEIGTFTEESVMRRLPDIARRTLAENELDATRTSLVEALVAEIHEGVVAEIDEPLLSDAAAWKEYVAPYLGMTWRDIPWFFAETYFYRRLLAATGYSQPGDREGVDPFTAQKAIGLDGAVPLGGRLGHVVDELPILLAASLWANRVDLSLWPAGEREAAARTADILGLNRSERLLADDTDRAVELLGEGSNSVHLILDNAGAELVADLMVTAHVLGRGGRVTIHLKPHPTFVSDVTLPDFEATIARLATEPAPASEVAGILTKSRGNGSLVVTTHPFWVSPLPFWECPPDLVDYLAEADLVIVKGDANYRRLLGDLHWDPTTPFEKIVRPLQPLLAVRAAKSLVAAGVAPAVARDALATDPTWLTDGEWGMIQFAGEIP
ncbi:MAG: damage-control phosphatase ARMT1 family protein [Acidimicrobiia bacterium]